MLGCNSLSDPPDMPGIGLFKYSWCLAIIKFWGTESSVKFLKLSIRREWEELLGLPCDFKCEEKFVRWYEFTWGGEKRKDEWRPVKRASLQELGGQVRTGQAWKPGTTCLLSLSTPVTGPPPPPPPVNYSLPQKFFREVWLRKKRIGNDPPFGVFPFRRIHPFSRIQVSLTIT